ncbi:MAG: hypothetical protein RL693_1192 [Verrucomicrobiota bacterium]
MRSRFPLFLLLLAAVFFIVCLWRDAATLPAKLATHFDGAGKPNDWMTRTQHLTFMTLFGLGVPAFILGVFYSVRLFPASSLNVPQAAYWKSPEHYPEACRILFEHGLWFAVLLLVWMTLLNDLIVSANRTAPPQLDNGSILMLTGGLLAGMSLWIALLLLRFSRIPKAR